MSLMEISQELYKKSIPKMCLRIKPNLLPAQEDSRTSVQEITP